MTYSLKKIQNVFPSIADSNRYTREFSLRRSTDHSNQIGGHSFDNLTHIKLLLSKSPWNPKPWC